MSRVAVAEHLSILESARLVTSQRRGREKLHFLNPVPIRLVHDRWVSKYTEGWAVRLVNLKDMLEATMEIAFEIYIKTSLDKTFTGLLQRRPNTGGRTDVVTPGSAEHFGPRRLVRSKGGIDGHPFQVDT